MAHAGTARPVRGARRRNPRTAPAGVAPPRRSGRRRGGGRRNRPLNQPFDVRANSDERSNVRRRPANDERRMIPTSTPYNEAVKTAEKPPAERAHAFTTISGRPIKALYTADDAVGVEPGEPGQFPYTRGIHPTGYRGKLWTMRQFAGFGTAADTNQRFKYLLSQGQTGLSVAFDFPTLMGYDSDHVRSEGEVGKTGVAISSLADMETLFDGIPLDQ